jgi:glycosyltransferase involved in cell wall biosynthesis
LFSKSGIKSIMSSRKLKLFRITTVAVSMNIILKGQLAYMNQYFEVTGITSYDKKHFEDVKSREGIRMIALKFQRAISPLQDLITLSKLAWLFYKERPYIVHTHTPKAGLLGMVAAWMMRVPVRIHTVGGLPLTETHGFKKKLLVALERLTYALSNRVYPNSKGLEKIIRQEILDDSKIKVLANGGSNGIDTDRFSMQALEKEGYHRRSFRDSLGIKENDFVFFFCGRIAREKGVVELLDAMDYLQVKHSHMKLLLIGLLEEHYGVLDPQDIARLKSNKNIVHPGRADDVRPFYAAVDCFVLPTYREGFPNAVLEAGAMGLPQIVTDINGCNEIVFHGVNGILIPHKDANALKDAMEKLINNSELRQSLKSNAREIIVQKFQNQVVWDALKLEYDNLLTA